jgi:hypothetical protein
MIVDNDLDIRRRGLPAVSYFEVLAGIATGLTDRAVFSAEARDLTIFCSVQTDSGVHPASYPMGTGYLTTLPSNAEVKNSGAIPPFPCASPWHCD